MLSRATARLVVPILMVVALAASACADDSSDGSAGSSASEPATRATAPKDRDDASSSATSSSTSSTSTTSAVPAATAATPTSVAPATTRPAPEFESSASEVPPEVRVRMDGRSMRPGCPVGYDELRYLRLTYRGFDGKDHLGEMVVNAAVADDVVGVFRRLHELGYPIERMTLVDDFGPGDTPMDGADDFASIEGNNTSAFNCRARTGSADQYSEHSYGWAIDLNPLLNPYVTSSGTTSHPRSRAFLDRTSTFPGVIRAGDPVVEAFAAIGWGWGGDWTGVRDYQHFSRSGR